LPADPWPGLYRRQRQAGKSKPAGSLAAHGAQVRRPASDQHGEARAQESRVREFCSSVALASCDWFLRAAEGAASTSIEDIYASPRRLLRAQFAGTGRDAEVSALANLTAVSQALEAEKAARDRGALTLDDIRSIHARLASRLPDYRDDYQHEPGELGRQQNWIDSGGGWGRLSAIDLGPTAASVRFVTPRPDDGEQLMNDLIVFCNRTGASAADGQAHRRIDRDARPRPRMGSHRELPRMCRDDAPCKEALRARGGSRRPAPLSQALGQTLIASSTIGRTTIYIDSAMRARCD